LLWQEMYVFHLSLWLSHGNGEMEDGKIQ